jgi:hypothetical protein
VLLSAAHLVGDPTEIHGDDFLTFPISQNEADRLRLAGGGLR